MRRIYLDHAATTPLLPEAREAMLPWLGPPANASSLHSEGRRARAAIDQARETLAEALGCLFGEVVFTSSGTEAANLALLGVALANPDPTRRRVLMGAAEHHCVLQVRPLLERIGYEVALVPVDHCARVEPSALAGLLSDDVLIVSVMTANNELGSLNPVHELAEHAHRVGSLFHTDAVQAFPPSGTVGIPVADAVSVSAHKIGGPTGVGALYVRGGTPIQPVMSGGGQERELRAGTETVAGIVGFSAAAKWCRDHPEIQGAKRSARDAFASRLVNAGFVPTLPDPAFLPGHFHCRFPGIDAETMLIRLDQMGVSASSGAACSSGSLEPSHVLTACGYSRQEAREGLRFTFGPDTSVEQAGEAAARVVRARDEVLKARGKP